MKQKKVTLRMQTFKMILKNLDVKIMPPIYPNLLSFKGPTANGISFIR